MAKASEIGRFQQEVSGQLALDAEGNHLRIRGPIVWINGQLGLVADQPRVGVWPTARKIGREWNRRGGWRTQRRQLSNAGEARITRQTPGKSRRNRLAKYERVLIIVEVDRRENGVVVHNPCSGTNDRLTVSQDLA